MPHFNYKQIKRFFTKSTIHKANYSQHHSAMALQYQQSPTFKIITALSLLRCHFMMVPLFQPSELPLCCQHTISPTYGCHFVTAFKTHYSTIPQFYHSTILPFHNTNHQQFYPSTAFIIPLFQMTNRVVLSWGCVIVVPKYHYFKVSLFVPCHCSKASKISLFQRSSIYHVTVPLFHSITGPNILTVLTVPSNTIPKNTALTKEWF